MLLDCTLIYTRIINVCQYALGKVLININFALRKVYSQSRGATFATLQVLLKFLSVSAKR